MAYALYAQQVSGQTLGVDLLAWDGDLYPTPFAWSATPIVGSIAITTIAGIVALGFSTNRDFKFTRDQMKALVVALGSGDEETGFDLLSLSEQYLAASYLIGTEAQQLTVFGSVEVKKEVLSKYKTQVQACRLARYRDVENDILNELRPYASQILNEIGQLGQYYYEYGLDGTLFGDAAGLSDYLYGTTPFDGIATIPWLGTTCVGLAGQAWINTSGQNMTVYTAYLGNKLFYEGMTT